MVILTRDGPEHRYVANTLCENLVIDRIFVDRRARRAKVRRALNKGIGHFLGKAARMAFLKVISDDKARAQSLLQLLGQKAETFYASDRLDWIDDINGNRTIALLRERNPDAILIYGTSIVQDKVLGEARDICLNMHTGVSPHYRGTACAFWPVVNGEFEMLGATIHECTSGIDAGSVFEIARSGYKAGDDLHTIFGRAVIAGADAYVQVVRRYLAGTLTGLAQDLSLGREYRGVDLTIGPELVARRRLARLRRLGRRRS
jgi:folate-dependent phosphoribosylglycinamide formyltransferase PurN